MFCYLFVKKLFYIEENLHLVVHMDVSLCFSSPLCIFHHVFWIRWRRWKAPGDRSQSLKHVEEVHPFAIQSIVLAGQIV